LLTLRAAAAKNDENVWNALPEEIRKASDERTIRINDKLSGLVWTPKQPKGKRAMFYIHGGGLWVSESRSEGPFCRAYAHALGATVVSVDYRRIPDEGSLQELIDDLVAGYLHLFTMGFDPKDVIVLGPSGGGAGTLYLLSELNKRGLPLPLAGAPLLPAGGGLELAENSLPIESWPSIIADLDPFVRSKLYLWAARNLHGPNVADTARDLLQVKRFIGLPPLYFTGSSCESFFSQQQHLALLAAQAGVNVTFYANAGGLHASEYMWMAMKGIAKDFKEPWDRNIAWVERQWVERENLEQK